MRDHNCYYLCIGEDRSRVYGGLSSKVVQVDYNSPLHLCTAHFAR